MASYIRSWLSSQIPVASTSQDNLNIVQSNLDDTPEIQVEVDEDDTDTVKGDDDNDDDSPPSFPSINSAQRLTSDNRASSNSDSTLPRILTDSELMPPPPLPILSNRRPGVPSASASLAVPSSASSLAVPTSTTKAPKKASRKVALAPGHGPLDWANLKKSGQDLRGVDTLTRIPMSVLKQHKKRDDAWSAFNGKVYNITPYLPYHPGGEKELMRVAGRDGTKLFSQTHAWVNIDYMLDACLVGFLVPDS